MRLTLIARAVATLGLSGPTATFSVAMAVSTSDSASENLTAGRSVISLDLTSPWKAAPGRHRCGGSNFAVRHELLAHSLTRQFPYAF